MTTKRMTGTLDSILKQLDAVQDLLAGDHDVWLESKALDEADTYVLAARNRLRSLIRQLDPQAAKDKANAQREQVMEDIRRAGPGLVPENYLVFALTHSPQDETMRPESTGPDIEPHSEEGGKFDNYAGPKAGPQPWPQTKKRLQNAKTHRA